MSAQEIVESEKRNSDNLYDIHFYMEGSFWRAYEWSAYLSRIFPSTLNEEERLKPIKKVTKECEDGYVQVGLQLPSFDKYFPNISTDEVIFEMLDKHIVIHAKKFFSDNDFSSYETLLREWKESIKLSDKEKKKNREMLTDDKNQSKPQFNSLVKEIISFPIENKNLVECLQFLSYIRDKATKISK